MIKEINIGGQQRPVRFGFNALAEFCKLTGVKIGNIDALGSNMDFGHIRALVYCGLKDGARKAGVNFNATVEDVGDWMDESKEAIAEAFDEFIASQAPAPTEEKKSQDNP
jgi:hypothetical protein